MLLAPLGEVEGNDSIGSVHLRSNYGLGATPAVALVRGDDQARELIEEIQHYPMLAIDTETTGLNPWKGDRMVGVSVYAPQLGEWYFPFRHVMGNLSGFVMGRLIAALSRVDRPVLFNAKFDLEMLHRDGMPYPAHCRDVLIGAHLINENEPNHKLKTLATRYVDPRAGEPEDRLNAVLAEHGLKSKADMWRLDPELVEEYASADARLTWQLYDYYLDRMMDPRNEGLFPLWDEVSEYALLMARAETLGLQLDVDLCQRYAEEADQKAEYYRREMNNLAGREINPASPKQMGEWLGLKSTRAEVLERLHAQGVQEAGIQTLIAYRGWARMRGAYYAAYLSLMDEDCVIHPNFNMVGTVTSRLSCERPNLQAVARKDAEWKKAKDVFIARPGYILVQADYSQAEMRLACWYAREEGMTQIIESGVNMHDATSQQLGIYRQAAKTINFSIVYGIGKRSLAQKLDVPENQAAQYLGKYHETYPGFRALYRRAEGIAKKTREIRLWTGRRKHYNLSEAETPTHKASSNLIQGGVGEILRVAQQRLDRELPEVRQLLQVHDSILSEVPEDELDRLLPEIKRLMEDFPDFRPSMVVDIQYGPRWGDLKTWETK